MGMHKRFDDDEEGTVTEKPVAAKANSWTPRPGRGISKPGNRGTKQHTGKPPKTKSVRSQLRSLERLLKNKGAEFTPGARKAKEEQLKELIRLRDEHDRRESEKKTAAKYRMLKFFERRKLQRILDKIIEHGDKPEEAEKKKQVLRDLRYVNEYPKDKKYIALFPTGGHTDESGRRVEEMRKEIEGKADRRGSEDPSGADEVKPVGNAAMNDGDDFFLNEESD